MLLNFIGDAQALKEGIEVLSKEFKFIMGEGGIEIEVIQGTGNLEVSFNNNKGCIKYDKKIHFFRGLGLFLEAIEEKDSFEIIEEPQFINNGPSFDCSRNGVLKVESIKKILTKMAVMGLNMIMLYTEDTYTIEQQPYFGYMRGKYSFKELKDCDDYANIFGIEMVPCIQTLGHLGSFLKWDVAKELRDTNDVLLVGSKKTYEFIEKMIKAISAPFRSKKIHIGMDEAEGIGRGRFLDENGYKEGYELLLRHLDTVLEITEKNGLEAMIWSDMFFSLASETKSYSEFNANIPKEVKENIPKGVKLVYWDYVHQDEAFTTKYLKIHKEFGSLPVFAGGIWSWQGICTDYRKTFNTMLPALNACKKEGVKEIIATVWGDNGTENSYFSTLLGLQFFAENGYAKELDLDKLKRRVKFCTGINYNNFDLLSKINEAPGTIIEKNESCNPSKYLLWQDILLGLFDKHVEGLDLDGYYRDLELKFKEREDKNSELDFVFDTAEKLCGVLKIKSNLGEKIKSYYDNMDLKNLAVVAEIELPLLIKNMQALKHAHYVQWFKTYKPFGWEVLDLRYGGSISRIETSIMRIKDFLEGNIDSIEELEEERLTFDGIDDRSNIGIGSYNQYHKIVTGCTLSQ